jgi:hypothetical protein
MPPCRWIDPGPTGICTFNPDDVTTTTTVAEVPPTPAFAADVLPRTGGSSVLLVVAVVCVAFGAWLRRLAA